MDLIKRNSKRIAIDVAGFTLVMLSLLLGWLPGPGGIPLMLAGLGLLSINHAWARRIRDTLIANGSKVAKLIFPDNRTIQFAYDIFAGILIVSIILMLQASQAYLTYILSGIVSFAAVGILLINRQRGERLYAKILKHRS
jgi:hypothetical protein